MSRTTIVSCYYTLEKSKHSLEEYLRWIHNFLTYVNTPIIMFSEGKTLQALIQMRNEANLGNFFFPIEKPLSELKFSNQDCETLYDSEVITKISTPYWAKDLKRRI